MNTNANMNDDTQHYNESLLFYRWKSVQLAARTNTTDNWPMDRESILDRRVVVKYVDHITSTFDLSKDTFYLAINIYDRYVRSVEDHSVLTIEELKVIGATSLVLASKYHEPRTDTMEWMELMKCNRADVLELEQDILVALNWELTVPTIYTFLRMLSEQFSVSMQSFDMAETLLRRMTEYISENSLPIYRTTEELIELGNGLKRPQECSFVDRMGIAAATIRCKN